MSADDLLMVAGEASGDLHGARLLSELKKARPELRAFGLGGGELRQAGFEAVADSSEISVVGITEALRILPRALRIFNELLAEVDKRGARGAVLIDSPDFNLRLAKKLKQRGVRVIYYISPQVWAWRRGRVRTIARVVDRMLVLFPFEAEFYEGHDVEVVHVGHPLIEEVPALPQAWEVPRGEGEPFVLSLLPGSRASEIRALLEVQLASAAELGRRLPLKVRLIEAPTVPEEMFERALAKSPLSDLQIEVERVREGRFQAIAGSHLALCASGTATLEVALLGTPLIVVYRLSRWSYLLARLLVRLHSFSIVNLVLGERVVPELLQHEAEPERIAREAESLLRDPERVTTLRGELSRVRELLGAGASQRAAREVVIGLDGGSRG